MCKPAHWISDRSDVLLGIFRMLVKPLFLSGLYVIFLQRVWWVGKVNYICYSTLDESWCYVNIAVDQYTMIDDIDKCNFCVV